MQWFPSDPMVVRGVVNINSIVRRMTIPLLPLLQFHLKVTMDAYNNNNDDEYGYHSSRYDDGHEDYRGINH